LPIRLGLVGVMLLGEFVRSLLVGVSPNDPATLVSALAAFLGVSILAACYQSILDRDAVATIPPRRNAKLSDLAISARL